MDKNHWSPARETDEAGQFEGNLVGDIMRYEDGSMDETEAVDFFSHLIKSGIINQLQGSYQRGAWALTQAGWLNEDGDVLAEIVGSE